MNAEPLLLLTKLVEFIIALLFLKVAYKGKFVNRSSHRYLWRNLDTCGASEF